MVEKPRLYIEDLSHEIDSIPLPLDLYRESSGGYIKVCADVVFANSCRRTIYLARRTIKPAQGHWWIIGGRMYPGEREEVAARRHLRDDTGLDLSQDRFRYVTINRYWWKDRQEDPQEKGCDHLAYTFVVEPTSEELVRVQLRPTEYNLGDGLQEFDRERLVKEGIDEGILDVYDQIFPAE